MLSLDDSQGLLVELLELLLLEPVVVMDLLVELLELLSMVPIVVLEGFEELLISTPSYCSYGVTSLSSRVPSAPTSGNMPYTVVLSWPWLSVGKDDYIYWLDTSLCWSMEPVLSEPLNFPCSSFSIVMEWLSSLCGNGADEPDGGGIYLIECSQSSALGCLLLLCLPLFFHCRLISNCNCFFRL